jgi:hypothetical protein
MVGVVEGAVGAVGEVAFPNVPGYEDLRPIYSIVRYSGFSQ